MTLTKITTGGITDATIATADIAADQITGALIADDAVGAEHIEQLDANISFADNTKATFGAGNDLQIYHNSSDGNSYIKESSSGSGCLAIDTDCFRVKNAAHSENLLAADEDGAVQLFYDNVKKFETTSGGAKLTGALEGDSDLILRPAAGNNNVIMQPNSGAETLLKATVNGAVELYHDNSKKFETTSDGIESNSELHFKAPSSTTGEQVGRIEWWNETDAGVMAKIGVDRTASPAAPADLVFSTSANIDTTANGGDGDITERMRIDSSGNVGIGVTPTMAAGGGLHIRGPAGHQARLHMTTSNSGDTGSDGFYIIQQGAESSNNETNFINYETASMKFSTSGTERMRIHSTGNVAVGNASPQQLLHVWPDTANTTSAYVRVTAGDRGSGTGLDLGHDSSGNCHVNAVSNAHLIFSTNNSERLRVANNGNALFHTTTNDNTIAGAGGIQLSDDANGSFIRISKKTTQAVPAIEFHNANGRVGQIIPSGTSTSYSTSGSDRTLKKNFESWSEDVLTLFKNINPQKFNFIQEEDGTEKTKGFIAQEIKDSFPEAYIKSFGENGKYMFNPSGMVVYLMKAIQDLNAKVEALEAA